MSEQLPFRIRRSAVEGKRPQNADLELGELALNTYDGRLFVKKDTGGVGVGTTVTLLTPWTETVGVGIYYTEGNVGLGTTNPTTKLFVSGDINFTGNLYQNGTIFQSGGGGGTSSQWTTYAAGISTLSNVGIGTTNPTTKLQVNGSVTLGAVSSDLITFPGRIASNLYPNGDGVYDIGRPTQIGSGANRWRDANFSGKGSFDGGVDAHNLELGVGSPNLIYSTSGNLELNSQSGTTNIDDILTVSGNTGIGTANPTTKLHVVGDVKISGVVTATSINFASGGVLGDLYTDGGIGIGVRSPANYYAIVASNNLQQFLQVDDTQIFITTGYASTTTGTYDWKFDKNGALTFPDSTIQSTAFTGYATTAGIATYATSAGTATTATNLSDAGNITTGTISSSRLTGSYGISITGTATTATNLSDAGNITTGTISSSRLTGSYGISITGTANTLADAANITTGTINKDRISTTNALTVLGDLYVSNNISFGGSTTQLNTQQLQIVDADIVLGIGTTFSPTDNTANHGGIAIASTEGSPLVNLNIVPEETNPSTYKKIMWFKGSSIGAGLTDAWLFNYAVGVGSTQVPYGVRLAVGQIKMTDSAITATTFTGNLTGTATTLADAANITTGTISSSRLSGTYGISITGTATTLSDAANITTGTISSSRLSGTYGISITGTATTANNVSSTININTSGIITASQLVSNVAQGTAPITVGSSTLVTNLNANYLNGQLGSYYTDATNLTGTISSSRLSGTYGISITGTATTLSDAANITTGTISSSRLSGTYGISITGTANTLSNAANITTGTISSSRLTGSYGIDITGTATTATNLSDAGNITTGTISSSRLSGTYGISITGTANTLADAANITTGIISSSRLSGTYGISITGTANTLADAANITTGTISSSRLTGSYGIDITGTATTATTALGFSTTASINTTGIITATKYYGDGSSLSGITASGSGIVVRSNGSPVGTAGTIDFTSNLSVSFGAGIATVSATGGSGGISSVSISTNTTNQNQLLTYVTGTGNTTGFGVSTTGLVFNPSTGNLGIGTTNPISKLQVVGNGLFSGTGIVTATTFVGSLTGTATTATTALGFSTTASINTSGIITASQLVSNVAQGTAPITVGSSTLVTNLNANYLNGQLGSYYTDATNLTGTISSSRLTGSYGISITGTATTLADAGNITTGTISSSRLSGSYGISITGTAATATNLSNAANITTGFISSDRLSGSYGIDITGTATTATNLSNAANITTGTISSSRLTGSYGIDITGTATTATNLSNAANITTGFISSDRLSGSYGISITGTATTATTALGFSTTANINTSGIITATKFSGDGSLLTNITASGTGISIKNNGSPVGTAGTIDFTSNLSVSFDAGTATVSATGGGSGGASSQWVTYAAGISTTSNVGIGSTAPTAPLDVVGNAKFTGIVTTTQLDLTGNATTDDSVLYLSGAPLGTSTKNGLLGIGQLSFSDTDIVANFVHDVNGYAQVVVQNKNSGASSSADIIVNNDRSAGTTYYGDFGINGTTFSGGGVFGDPDGTYLYSAGGTLTFGSLNTNDVKIATNNTERVRILSNGQVGIGTTNPQYPLQVQGNARITGAVYDSTNSPGTSGQVLQSTQTGTQWISRPTLGLTVASTYNMFMP